MSQVTRQTGKTNAVTVPSDEPKPPQITQALAVWIGNVQNGYLSEPLHDTIRAQARSALAQYDRILASAGYAVINNWLITLSLSCSSPPVKDDFANRRDAMMDVLLELPAVAFTHLSNKAAKRTFFYFPGAAELVAFLSGDAPPTCKSAGKCMEALSCLERCRATFSPDADRGVPNVRTWRRDQSALRRVIALPEPPPAPDLSQAERDAVLARFRGQMAEVDAERAERERLAAEAEAAARSAPAPPSPAAQARADALVAHLRATDPRILAARASQQADRRGGAVSRGTPNPGGHQAASQGRETGISSDENWRR